MLSIKIHLYAASQGDQPILPVARLAQSVERKALNLVVVGSSPTVGVYVCEHLQLPVVIHTVKRGNGPHQPDGLSQAMPWSTIL